MSIQQTRIGAVVIGRNEGERLSACIKSLKKDLDIVYYVDSGSTDNSVQLAENLQATVINLDMSVPFTAARARNEGFKAMISDFPTIEFVQFVDGDCEVVEGWIDSAAAFLSENPTVAACCGRRREKFPEISIYNFFCDIEWDTPIGKTKSCGGDSLMRVDAFKSVGGFRKDLIAGEEPELCVRLRHNDFEIHRLDFEMTLHDAQITTFNQWCKRAMRGGFAFAQGANIHGAAPECHKVRERNRVLFWGGALPLAILTTVLFVSPLFLSLLLLYPVSIVKVFLQVQSRIKNALVYSIFMMVGKFPECAGALKFYAQDFLGKESKLIEYK